MYLNSKEHLDNLSAAREKANRKDHQCVHCSKMYTKGNIDKHILSCDKNPTNTVPCPVCKSQFKPKKSSKGRFTTTCSRACANTYFRSGPNHGNWSEKQYRSTCFHYHKKECVVCKESNIVEVHHLDENHDNNDPSNLIPLCPTHHQYWHSKFKHLIEDDVLNYIKNWSG